MFGRRKSQKQEEPLVPHGLIWQATDELEETAQPARLETPAPSAEAIEMSSRHENPPDAAPQDTTAPVAQTLRSAQPNPNATRLGAISPPIQWPSPKSASIIRRTPPPATPVIANSAPTSPAVPQKTQPQVVSEVVAAMQAETERAAMEVPAPVAPVHRESRWQNDLRQIRESLRQNTKDAREGAAQTFVLLGDKARTAYAGINLQARFSKARQRVEKGILAAIAGCRSSGVRLRSSWTSISPHIARVKAAGEKFSSEAVKTSSAQGANLIERVRSHRVRIRIERPARVQAWINGGRMAWAMSRESIRREPRLWTSMAMAAVSALLAVVVISAVSRYAPGADASSKSVAPPANSSIAINPTIVVGPRVGAESRTKTNASAPRRASAQTSSSGTPARNTTPRAHHPVDDDGYVAPNSYHYYGADGKSTGK